MNTFYNHVYMFLMTFYLFLLSVLTCIYSVLNNTLIFISLDIFSSWFLFLDVSFLLDSSSLCFSSIVLLISSVVMIYSYFYMSPYAKSVYFLWATFMFVASMLMVVLMSNLLCLMLGWDGLGMVSFFLIVYYQNSSSIISGIFTLLMNRIGDSFFLVSIVCLSLFYRDLFVFSSDILSLFCISMLLITFMTKSALYPFSSWLPMAMSAPTPISSLVHSSTLVTAGLYLMMRFSYVIYSSVVLIKVILVIGLFTSLYAGFNTVFETDLKKLVALSTLSHLGFIAFSFASGMLSLSFFHLLTHALFKSLLFMSLGDIIINLNHAQDFRYLSSGISYTPFSSFVMLTSVLNLLGMPNLSGFYSKDLVLELFLFSNSGVFLLFILYLNVFFTFLYSYKLLYFIFSKNKLFSYQMFHSPSLFHSFCMLVLGIISVSFGKMFLELFAASTFFFSIPFYLKIFPVVLNTMFFVYLLIFLTFPTFKNPLLTFIFSNMALLTPFLMSMFSFLYYKISFSLVKDFEMGFINNLLHNSMPFYLSKSLVYIFKAYSYGVYFMLLLGCFMVFMFL